MRGAAPAAPAHSLGACWERLHAGMAVAVQINAKGFFPEDHPNFIGCYWSALSSPYTGEVVVSADAYMFVGPAFHDLSTAGECVLRVCVVCVCGGGWVGGEYVVQRTVRRLQAGGVWGRAHGCCRP